jgi:outer membrane protein OmpA-like peptidoglycan-associated protein
MQLSQARADAVVQELVARGIPAARLKAFGNGPYAPVASNDAESGRAKNRRVELVKQ